MTATGISMKTGRPIWIFMLAFLAALSLAFVWRGAGRMMRMQTQAASEGEFAQLRAEESTKIVVEVGDATGNGNADGLIRGKVLEKQDETHYARTAGKADVRWGKETAVVMGKAEDIRAGAVIHVTGKVGADHSVQAKQIVILTGYVQVK